MEVTRAWLDSVARVGACQDRLRMYKPEMQLSQVQRRDLQWIEEAAPELAKAALSVAKQPGSVLWGRLPLSELGSGYGYGFSWPVPQP